MNSRLSSWCDSLIEIGCIAALIATPLFFNVHSDRVFEPDKLTVLRSVAVFLSAIWLVKFVDQQSWENLSWLRWKSDNSIWKTPFVLPTVILALVYLIANLFSVTPSVSWAGSYQRLQGTYTTLSYIIVFALTAHVIRTPAQARRLITAVIITSIPVALYAMLQRFGLDPLPWGGNVTRRVAGHMGNAIFVAAYLIMVVPLTVGRIISSFSNILTDEELSYADIIRSSIYIFALAIQLIAIWFSGSRGPQLGLAIGLFAFVLIFLVSLRNTVSGKRGYATNDLLGAAAIALVPIMAFLVAVFGGDFAPLTSFGIFVGGVGVAILAIFVLLALGRGWKWLWLSWMMVAIVGAVWLVGFNFTADLPVGNSPVLQTFDDWRNEGAIGRLGRMLEDDSGTGRVRVLIWQGAMELFLPHEPLEYPDGSTDSLNAIRPLIGYGPESMYVAYNSFYPPELGTLEARNASPDRSHNETWDALVITGAFGFLVWQWLYLSVFYYGFKWLGVVQSTRDRNLLIGSWIVFGVALAAVFSVWRGPEYLGVALPIGSILGLIVYLVYYAVTARPDDTAATVNPFGGLRLLMIGLIGAILAYYVEIHLGIAIAATRTHFFVYAGLMLVLGHVLHLVDAQTADEEEPEPVPVKTKRGRGRGRSGGRASTPRWVGPAFEWAFLLGIVVAILGYNFIIFSPPPDLQIRSVEDLPSAAEMLRQAWFVNPSQNFSESPFIFLLTMMSWALGGLLVISEMVKSNVFRIRAEIADTTNDRTVGYIFGGLAVLLTGFFVAGFFELTGEPLTATQRTGYLTLSPLGALLSAFAATSLIFQRPHANLIAAGTGLGMLSVSLPLFLAGGTGIWMGLIFIGVGGAVLYMLWGAAVGALVKPAATVMLGGLSIGVLFAYLQAGRIRSSLFSPPGLETGTPETVRRVAEADQFATILSLFYVYLFFFLMVAGFALALRYASHKSTGGTIPGWLTLVLVLPLAFVAVNRSNLEVIHADMIYKRGKPWDNQASGAARNGNQEAALQFWDNSISIYERAIELTPTEDFYYLWLGRAYLEKSGLLQGEERDEVLETAEASLFRAQNINPLNTDHTANLARLNTRWASVVQDGPVKEEKVDNAGEFYRAAIDLSPQNSTIRNEYARMVYSFTQDCERAFDLYEESIDADPLFENTRFEYAEILSVCASNAPEGERDVYYDRIYDNTVRGIELQKRPRNNADRWLRTAQTFQQFQAYDYALDAYEQAARYADDRTPLWRIEYFTATAHQEAGNTDQARELAQSALADAPQDVAPQIEQFLASLDQQG